ncbi:MAG: PhzF family phenazine biosynthesis protein [Thermoplasmatota archaeon]
MACAMTFGVPFAHVDAFTDKPFRGNPAVVCELTAPLPEAMMQAIAAEMNVSETAFVEPPRADGIRPLRWFTPKVEVPLCGHATLATAAVLLAHEGPNDLFFATRSGTLGARPEAGGIALDFPAESAAITPLPTALVRALGLEAEQCVAAAFNARMGKILVEAASAADVRRVHPNAAALMAASGTEVRGVILTSRGDDGFDFVSRYFAPWVGIPEDPVTGSAHAVLGPYWSAKLGKTALRAFQASPRGGEMVVRMRGDRLDLVGRAGIGTKPVRSPLSLPRLEELRGPWPLFAGSEPVRSGCRW